MGTNNAINATNVIHCLIVGTGSGYVSVANGSTGQVLQANSAGDPTFSTATFPSTATGTGTILRADGTNWVATTSTYPSTNAVSTLLYASATNVMSALATANNGILVTSATGVPSILAGPGTTGTILQSNAAAAPSFSTATYPSTTTVNQLLYSSATNVVGGVTAVIDGVLISNHAAGVPSWLANGTAGFVLTAQSGAPPAWAAAGGGVTAAFNQVTVQVFTSTGTYTPTTGMKYCTIEVVGGGGGGGGADGDTTLAATGGGGGGGGYGRKTVTAATIGASQAVTIGAAGAAGAAGANAGGTGGTSSLGAIVTATGGVGGAGSVLPGGPYSYAAGGAGGVGGSGDFNCNGGGGGAGLAAGTSAVGNWAMGGQGGSSIFGGGVASGICSSNGTTSAAGNTGVLYGGGGSGGCVAFTTNTNVAGGAGVKGIVVVTEYLSV